MSDKYEVDDEERERDRRQKVSDLFNAVHLLLEARTAKFLRDEVRKGLQEAIGDRELMVTSAAALKESLRRNGYSEEEATRQTEAARDLLGTASGVPSPELERVFDQAVKEGMPQVVLAWANALHAAASESGGASWLRLSLLGPDMLPVNDDEAATVFDAHFAPYDVLDPALAREMLTMLRAALPAGKAIPDELAAALDAAWGVVAVL